MNKLKRRILSFVAAAAVAVASIGIVPDIGGFVPSLTTEASAVSGISARANLTGANAALYDALKPAILEIAAGTRTSTEISVDANTLFGGSDALTWTLTDLGLTGNPTNEEIFTGILTTYSLNYSLVYKALCRDCPFDMFWYGNLNGCGYAIATTTTGSGTTYSLSGNAITFVLAVSQDYSIDGTTGKFETDAGQTGSKIDAAQAVKTSAQAIVTANSGKPMLARISAYKQAICDAVAYNDAVLTSPPPYGNPWQLIWVFDTDPDTDVVCEGYAKAFKYLCDLDGGISCMLVTGTMDGATGAGGHMWNIVKMDDGNNYLVDVTNCDTGKVGYPAELLVAVPDNGTGTSAKPFSFEFDPYNIVTYYYDTDTLATFTAAELTLSTTAYSISDSVVEGVSLTLGGDIGVNIYLTVPADLVNDNAQYTVTGVNAPVTAKISDLPTVTSGEFSGCRKVTYLVNATQMASPITLSITDSSDNTLTLYNYKKEQCDGNQYVTSVNAYLNAVMESPAGTGNAYLNAVVQSMYNYGQYAAKYFNDTAVSGISQSMYLVGYAEPTVSNLSGYIMDKNGPAPTGITVTGTTLVLNTKTSVRLYFKGTQTDVDAITITANVNGGSAVDTNIGYNNGKYYVEIPDIAADELYANTYVVHFGTDYTVTFSPMNYVYSALKNSDKADLINLSKAVYDYSLFAWNYALYLASL